MYGSIPYMMPGVASNIGPAALGANALNAGAKTSLLSKINWSSLLSNTQKTLNVVNQAIPLYYQIKPVFSNLKTLGRIGKEFTRISNTNDNQIEQDNSSNNQTQTNNNTNPSIPNPTFFL